jgi:hypothetical protein
MLTKNSNMLFLSLHMLAAARGDGLRPELVDLFKSLAAGYRYHSFRIRSDLSGIAPRVSKERFCAQKAVRRWSASRSLAR